ncbi:hypothetical protein [Paraburkholderia sp. SIMBA_030]|uniref:hypothetical protein n=1 Tax=Paraburkholderia sp. SIMBA_030 TaxID=3085773 RepID=UPI0039791F3C
MVDVAEGILVEKPSRTVADSRRGCRAENVISHLLEREFAIKLHFQLEPIFKNLRMLRLKTSSFIDISHFPMKERFPTVKLSPAGGHPHAIESNCPR